MKSVLIAWLVVLTTPFYAQQHPDMLRLEDCYKWADENYPLSKKRDLIAKSNEFSISNIAKGYYPRLDVFGQATYQSDVTKIPISLPGITVPELNKDQYKAYAEVNQLLYDGGALQQQKTMARAQAKVEQQQLQVDLYSVRQKVSDLYFGILIFDEQLKQSELLKNDIRIGINTVSAQLSNGMAYRSSVDVLKAELLTADQQAVSIKSYRKAYLEMLALFINKELGNDTELEIPEAVIVSQQVNRPELSLFDLKEASLDIGKENISAANRPKLGLFIQGGVGDPALNIFDKNLDTYYIGGIRLNWSLTGFYTSKKQKQVIDISKMEIEADKEAFLFNTNQALKQQNAEIAKLQEFLVSDDEIITLRSNVKKAALAQLENGIIDASDYLREVNQENSAAQNKIVHQTELLQAQYKQKILTGN